MRLLKLPVGIVQSKVIALSLDEQSGRLVSASEDGLLRVWDVNALIEVATQESIQQDLLAKLLPIKTIQSHKDTCVTALIVNGSFIVSCDVDGNVYKSDLESNESTQLFQHTAEINDIANLNSIILFATATGVISYDLATDKMLAEIPSRADVRAISVDPSKAYLATVGFNRVVSLYQIELFQDELLYKKNTVASQTLVSINNHCKISWSPAGDRLAIPNVNLDPNTAAIGMVSRSNWRPDFSLVGQDCNAVRFCPLVFDDADAKRNYNIIASSGVDKSIAVWNTTFQRPLVTAAEVTIEPITDIQWHSDGMSFFAAAESIVVFVFEPEELGRSLPKEIVGDLLSKLKVPEPLHLRLPPKPERASQPPAPITEPSSISRPDPEESLPPSKSVTTAPDALNPDSVTPSSTTNEIERTEPTIEQAYITKKDGKKRIAPTLVSTVNGKPASTTQLAVATRTEGSNTAMEFDAPSYTAPKSLIRRENPSGTDDPAKKKREVEAVEFVGSVAINPNTSFAKIRISTPKIRSAFTTDSPDDETLSLEVRNGSGTEQKPTKVTLLKNGTKQVFVDFIPKLIGLATGGEGYFWAISTVDGILYVYSDSGRRLFPPLVLGTPISFLECKGKYLLAVTSIGEVYVWNVEAGKATMEPTTLYPLLSRSNNELLTRAENLTMCSISSSGIPVVTVSNGNGYLYDSDMDAWTLISDSWWAFASQYWDTRDAKADSSIISLLEKKTNDEIVRRGRGKFLQKMAKTMLMKEGYENLEKTISLAHLENRILTSLKLKNAVEFKAHLIIYCKRVSEMGLKARLQEVFEDLMGPSEGETDDRWNSQVLGYDKRELLKELIFACASIRAVQRTLASFATELNILDQFSF